MQAESRKHIIILAMFFPPSRGSGVFRPLAMANFLVARGWRVTVLTVPEKFFVRVTGSEDTALLKTLDPRVQVERVDFSYSHLITSVRDLTKREAYFRAFYVKRWLKSRTRSIPDKYTTWIEPAVRRATEINRKNPVSVILATGNPWSAFEAARMISAKLHKPFIADYRDSWTLNQFTEEPAYSDKSPEVAAESRIFRQAAAILMVNPPMRDWHASRYPEQAEKIHVIENGYDAELFEAQEFQPKNPKRPLKFGYVGTVTAQLPHEITWAGWRLAREYPELAGASVDIYGHLGFFAHGREELRSLLPTEEEGVHYRGAVAKSQLGEVYSDLDVMLMMIPSSKYVTGGKTYENMATGKPVVAIHTPQTAASIPMAGYPLAFPIAEFNAQGVAEAIRQAAKAARNLTEQTYQQAMTHARQYRRTVQLIKLEQLLDQVSGDD